MSSSAPVPAKSSGLSLYANLLDPSAATTPASVSRDPVVFKNAGLPSAEEASAKKPTIDPSALRFQPTKRPQLTQKMKPKSSFPKVIPVESKSNNDVAAAQNVLRPASKSTLADWTAVDDDDVNGFYEGEKRQRGGRKRRKKNKEEHVEVQDWDDIFDPTRPISYEEYKHSEEKIREVREWKDRLYAHRIAKRAASEKDSEQEGDYKPSMGAQFAPPTGYSFAPPPAPAASTSPPPPPPADNAEEENHSPYMELSRPLPPPPRPNEQPLSQPSIPLATVSAPTMSRAPVRYNLPSAPAEIPASEAELDKALAQEHAEEPITEEASERSLRPGQAGFAQRLMSKYGWSRGSGLGASGSGIINPLQVKVEKRKKKSDAEGGGYRDTGGRGKIVGGKKKIAGKDDHEDGKFGAMSEVIVLRGMVDGLDLEEEVGRGELVQEIGEECGEKYGRVERVYIDRSGAGEAKVFVKFTSQLSGLRAVNALEGRIFNGNAISAMFFDAEKFEQGMYE